MRGAVQGMIKKLLFAYFHLEHFEKNKSKVVLL